MTDLSTTDRICLCLLGAEREGDGAVTTAALLDALGVGERAFTDHFDAISSLSAAKSRGLVAATESSTDDGATRYELTETGRSNARAVEAELRDRRVAVETPSGRDRLAVGEAAERFDLTLSALVGRLVGDVLVVDDAATAVDPVTSPFVGRAETLTWLGERLESAGTESVTPVRLEGEPGVGKTALLDALADQAADRGALALVGQCSRATEAPYGPVRDALASLPDAERERALAPLSPTASTEAEPDATAADGGNPPDPEELDERREALFADVAAALSSVADDRPVVLAVDDAQWIDRPTALLLASLSAALADDDFLVVAATYPSDGADTLSAAFAEVDRDPATRTLGPFDRETTGNLVAELVGTRAVPDRFVDAVHDHAGGNPLFVTEAVTWLLDEGLVRPETGRYPDADADLPVPETAAAAVTDRLDALDDATRALVETASLVGTTVPERVLVSASDHDPSTVRERVALLVESRLWERDGDQVRFVSDVVRRAVRDAVPEADRPEYHRRIADAFADADDAAEAVDDAVEGADGASGDTGAVADAAAAAAHHYDAAGCPAAAVDAALEAAEYATDVYAHEVAVEACEQAVESARAADDETAVVSAMKLQGETYYAVGDLDEAARCFEYVRERSNDPERVLQMYTREGTVDLKRGEFDAARESFEAFLDYHGTVDADPPKGEALSNLGAVALMQGEFGTAREYFERAVDRQGERDDAVGQARSLDNLGIVERKEGNYERAASIHRRSVERFREEGDRNDVARALGNLGHVAMERGDTGTAREAFAETLELKRAIGDPYGEAKSLDNLGIVDGMDGDYDRARDRIERARALKAEVGDDHGAAQAVLHHATADRRAGDYDAARERYEEALERLRAVGDRSREGKALGGLGLVAWETGDADAAVDRLSSAVDVFEETGEEATRARYRGALGAVELARGNVEVGRSLRADALATLSQTEERFAEVTVLRHHAEVEHEHGDSDRARDLHEQARDLLASTDASLGTEREKVAALGDRLAE